MDYKSFDGRGWHPASILMPIAISSRNSLTLELLLCLDHSHVHASLAAGSGLPTALSPRRIVLQFWIEQFSYFTTKPLKVLAWHQKRISLIFMRKFTCPTFGVGIEAVGNRIWNTCGISKGVGMAMPPLMGKAKAYQRWRSRQRMNLRASREKFLLVSLTIRQTLASCTFNGKVCTYPIVDAKRNAV